MYIKNLTPFITKMRRYAPLKKISKLVFKARVD